MKHETCWASTDKALVEQWQSGCKGRCVLAEAFEETLQTSELRIFLEGLDATHEEPERIHSRGCWVTLFRVLFATLPSKRAR